MEPRSFARHKCPARSAGRVVATAAPFSVTRGPLSSAIGRHTSEYVFPDTVSSREKLYDVRSKATAIVPRSVGTVMFACVRLESAAGGPRCGATQARKAARPSATAG